MLDQMGLNAAPRAGVLLCLLLASLALAPQARGDHEFSHRVELYGRVVDSEGHPVPGAPVNLTLHGIDAPRLCFDAKDERTDERGDFHLCRHHHELPEGVEATLEVAGTSARVGLDPHARRAYVALMLDRPWEVRSIQGERTFYRQVAVTARLVDVLPAPAKMEAVEVPGAPRTGAAANVTIADALGAVLANGSARSDGFGELRVDLALADIPEGARVRIETAFATRAAALDATLRRADFLLLHTIDTPVAPPGSQTPLPAALAVGALALAALGLRRR